MQIYPNVLQNITTKQISNIYNMNTSDGDNLACSEISGTGNII